MSHPGLRFGVAALTAWRVTHLLAEEDGPAGVILRARAAVGDSPGGELMDCFNCMSLWVAAPLAAAGAGPAHERAIRWLALSGAACLLEQASTRRSPEDRHGVLWQGKDGDPEVGQRPDQPGGAADEVDGRQGAGGGPAAVAPHAARRHPARAAGHAGAPGAAAGRSALSGAQGGW
jgi:hypothetical protein